jgi:hypothetical protein
MNDSRKSRIVKIIAESIDIPDSAYDRADARYRDLGEWFGRKEARCHTFDPHIYVQGSFRLGTVIRPVDENGKYDLDMGCRLRNGITKASHTQQQLKNLVGADLKDYRVARGIKEGIEEKHRCWRLKYADSLQFHLDVVPSVPETAERFQRIQEAMARTGVPVGLARRVAGMTGAITDNQRRNYTFIDDDWRISNSVGFALWFEWRMEQFRALMEGLEMRAKAAKVDRLPAYRWKSPLQRCVQLLKRHRDVMFASDLDGLPASVIITTLAALAYQGEAGIDEALDSILTGMEGHINRFAPWVPNPVYPAEDFADSWSDSKRKTNFRRWLGQAQQDFDALRRERRPEVIAGVAMEKLRVQLNEKDLRNILGISSTRSLLRSAAVPAGISFPDRPLVPKKPEGFA